MPKVHAEVDMQHRKSDFYFSLLTYHPLPAVAEPHRRRGTLLKLMGQTNLMSDWNQLPPPPFIGIRCPLMCEYPMIGISCPTLLEYVMSLRQFH